MNYEFPKWMGELPRASSPWGEIEEEVLVAAYRQGETLKQVAKKHGRAEGSINSRLYRILGENYDYRPLALGKVVHNKLYTEQLMMVIGNRISGGVREVFGSVSACGTTVTIK